MANKKGGLGRGLQSLLGGESPTSDEKTQTAPVKDASLPQKSISLKQIKTNPLQPRKLFDAEALDELADSIRQHGVLQPLLVRPLKEGSYELVAGERRFRAAQKAGLSEVPVYVRILSDKEVAHLALVENLQRESLTVREEAKAYQRLIDEFSMHQEDIAEAVGKSRPHIANTLRLLALPDEVLDLIDEEKLTAGHGRALLGVAEEDRLSLAKEAASKGMSVRALEAFVRGLSPTKVVRDNTKNTPSLLEHQLSERLQTRVALKGRGKSKRLEISYYSDEDLKRILDMLGLELY